MAKAFVERTASNEMAWSAYGLCGRVSDYLGRIYGHARWAREVMRRDELLSRVVEELFPDLTVASGPFRGMRYPREQSLGSVLLPKLLGSYESELHSALEQLCTNDYTTVVDVGCAEGFYAVGLGLRLKTAVIYAFDIDRRAREACEEMARLNGLNGRMHVAGRCDEESLRSIPLGRRALIISDCEGYERELFTSGVGDILADHDLIVETHDFIDINTSQLMRAAFSRTHRIQSILSIDDIQKAHNYKYEKLARYDASARRLILGERRPAIMEWLVMTSLANCTVSKDCNGR